MKLVHHLLTKCLDHIALYGNEGVLVSALFTEVFHDVSSPSFEIQELLWKLLISQAANKVISIHARLSQLTQKGLAPVPTISRDNKKVIKGSIAQLSEKKSFFCCSKLQDDQLDEKASNSSRLAIVKALSILDDVNSVWSNLHVVGCYELRQRALNLPTREMLENFEHSQLNILELIGQSRHFGITFSDLQKKLEAVMLQATEHTYVLAIHDGKLCSKNGHDTSDEGDLYIDSPVVKDLKPAAWNLKKLHYVLDTLVSYHLVVKRILLVYKPTQRKLNILHLPRFADMFHPEMLNKSAEFLIDDISKIRLIQTAINYLQKQVDQSAVLVEMGYKLGLHKRELKLLQTCIAEGNTKNAQNNSKYPLVFFQAVLPSRGKRSKENKLLNCIKYVGTSEDVPGACSQSPTSSSVNEHEGSGIETGSARSKGIFAEIGLIQHLYDYIINSRDRGTTIIDLRNEYCLPGNKMPYKLLGEAVSRYQLVARQELIGKNEGFRFFDRSVTDALDPTTKAHHKVRKEGGQKSISAPEQYTPSKMEEQRTDNKDKLGRITQQQTQNDSTINSRKSVSANNRSMTIKKAIGAEGVQTVEGNRIQRLSHIMERVIKEKAVALLSLKASINALERKLASKRQDTRKAQVIDTRTLHRLVLKLQAESKLKIKKREIQPRSVSGKVKMLHFVILPSEEHNEEILHQFVQSYARDERLRRMHHSQPSNANVILLKDHACHDAISSNLPPASTSTNGLEPCPTKRDSRSQNFSISQPGRIVQYRERKYVKRCEMHMRYRQYRKLGLEVGSIFRSKLLHEFLWKFLNQNTTCRIREISEQGKKNYSKSEHGISGILFPLEEVLHAMPVSLYIKIFAGGSLLSATEFAQLQDVMKSENIFSALPDKLCERIWYREGMRTEKFLGILVDLHLLSPRKFAIADLNDLLAKECNGADVCDTFSRALLANSNDTLFSLHTGNVPIVLSQNKASGGDNEVNILPKIKTCMRVFGYPKEKYSFGFDLPLRFDFTTYDQVTQYWQALKCLCLEKVMAEITTTPEISSAFGLVPRPQPTRSLRMFSEAEWNSNSKKFPATRHLPNHARGIVSRATRKRRSSKEKLTSNSGLKRLRLPEKTAPLLTAPEITKRPKDPCQEVTPLPTRRRRTNRSIYSVWTIQQDGQLQDLYLDYTRTNWRALVPAELKESPDVVYLRRPCLHGLKTNLTELARKLGKTRQDVLQRLKNLCTKPSFLLMLENAKQEVQAERAISKEEKAIITSNELTALFRRAVMMAVCPQEEYIPVIAEKLVCHWRPNDVRLIWRYMWLNYWIVRPRLYAHRARGFVASWQLQNLLKLQPPSYPVSLFLQAADPDSIIEFNENICMDRDTYQRCTFDAETEFPVNAMPGDCALGLSCQVLGSCALKPNLLSDDIGGLAAKESVEEKNLNLSSVEDKEYNNKLRSCGFAAHVTECTSCSDLVVLMHAWQVVVRFRSANTGTPDALEELQTFSTAPLDSSIVNREGIGIRVEWLTSKPRLLAEIKNAIISTTKQRHGEGITFDDLLSCLKVANSTLAEDSKAIAAIHASGHGHRIEELVMDVLNSCVKENALLCVNGYQRQVYVHPKFGNQWLLHPYALTTDQRKLTMERVEFDLSSGVPLYPWSKMNGEINETFLFSIQRKILACLLENPGFSDRHIHRELNRLLTLQDTRDVLEMLVQKSVIYSRGVLPRDGRGHEAHLSTTNSCMLWDRCFKISIEADPTKGAAFDPKVLRLQSSTVDHDRRAIQLHYFPHVDCVQRFGTIAQGLF
uniref:Uncharacterized protein AlNc14C186G8331 n=1 Tax=Albugo laibachii Nc14 TaxID=890382 RepID=F0WPI6_9STRA|nr:conserved hypothetical protein [Albugo laibachii Nc14]|eukprot:CCA23234.1 conserved hypothetical protein [Albugo laibachii Nc14]